MSCIIDSFIHSVALVASNYRFLAHGVVALDNVEIVVVPAVVVIDALIS